MKRIALTFALCAALTACNRGDTQGQGARAEAPAAFAVKPNQTPTIDANAILERIKVLSSDEYEGRAPGTKGEDLTVSYLTEEMKKLGLQPGNPDGTYVQKVPLAP